jgi:integrase|nr:MAG TPA: Integrase [Caudoviricetes sp.]
MQRGGSVICKNKGCGREIDGDSVYCKWCGTRQVREKRTRSDAPTARQLPSGSWTCRVRVDGRDVSITRPTKAEAVAEASAIKHGLKAPDKAVSTMTLKEAYRKYIESRDGVISPSTAAEYKRLQKTSFQSLMELSASSITSEQIQREIGKMVKNGKSPKYIRNVEGLLVSVLKQFAPDSRISVILPQKRKVELRKIEDNEIGKIIAAFSGTDMELPVLMALWMGMRMSEIRGARFEDISGGRLHICRAIVSGENGDEVKPPKTFSGDRWVSVPVHIQTLIDATGRSEGYIIPISGQTIYNRFIRGLDAAGIPRCRFHDLRHANAAIMVRLGVESRYAQERNGWSDDWMYKQVYAYTMTDRMIEIDRSIDDYFDNKMTTTVQKNEC